MQTLNRLEIRDGIYFNSFSDLRFKTNQISAYFVIPLKSETAALAALLPNILRKGCRNYSDFTDFSHYLSELYGAYVDYGVEKIGDEQLIDISIFGIDNKFTLENENITRDISKVLCELILDPVFENNEFLEAELALEKASLIDAINAEINDKRTYALNETTKLMCAGEPYGVSKYGTVEQVNKITAATLTSFYKEILKTARTEIIFVGSGCVDTAKDVFTQSFSKIDRACTPAPKTKTHSAATSVIEKTERLDVTQSKMVLGFASGLCATDVQITALHLAVAILGGTPMSKLFLNVREKLSLCYYCAARLDTTKGIVKIDCGVENENIKKARAEILNQLEQMKLGNFTEEDIKNARMSIENSYKTIGDSNGAVTGYYLGQIITGNMKSPEERIMELSKITKEQIIAAINLLHLDIVYVLTGK